jgi:hypothetical protein
MRSECTNMRREDEREEGEKLNFQVGSECVKEISNSNRDYGFNLHECLV